MLASSPIPLLMVMAFLLLTLGIAYRFTKSSASFQEYAIGNRQFPTGYLVATLLATAYGGGTLIRNVELVHRYGLYLLLLILFTSLFCAWMISLLALRMAPFMKHLSMSETIGSIYGTAPRVITSLACIVSAVPCMVIQIHVMVLAIGMCVDSINPHLLTTISIIILIFYVSIGGIRAVMVTDIVQLFTFCTILPLFAWWIFTKTGKPLGEFFSFVQAQEQFQLGSMYHTRMHMLGSIYHTKMDIKNIVGLVLPHLVATIIPPIIQIMYMSKDHFQASRVFLNAGISFVCIQCFILVMGLFTFSIAPGLSVIEIWHSILASSPSLLKGLISISLLALSMSTVDSFLNSCSIILSHDMLEAVRGPRAVPYAHQLKLARYIACFIGIITMVYSYHQHDLVRLVEYYFDCYIPIVTAPFILAVLGFRSNTRTALMGMATGCITVCMWNHWLKPITGMNGSFFCMLANCLAMFMTHWIGGSQDKDI